MVSVAVLSESVAEGEKALFEVTRDRATGAPVDASVEITAEGGVLSGDAPVAAKVPVGETRALLRVATDDDRVVEGDGSVTATVTAGEGYALGETLSATVAVEDGVTFAEDRTLALAVAGEVAESDYDLDPSTLVLAADGSSVQSTFAALADVVDEEVETAEVAALDPGGNPLADLRPAARAGPRRQRSRARGAASRSEARGRRRGVGDACGTGGGRAEAETPMWTRWDRAGDGENGGQGAELRIGLGERTGNHGDDGPRLPGP